jgi:hypothetical protein
MFAKVAWPPGRACSSVCRVTGALSTDGNPSCQKTVVFPKRVELAKSTKSAVRNGASHVEKRAKDTSNALGAGYGFQLEVELHSQLNNTRRICQRSNSAEGGTILDVRVRSTELRVVERIKHLDAELQIVFVLFAEVIIFE